MRSMSFALILALASPLFAGNKNHLRFTQEHGLTFSEIGDVGNPGFTNSIPGQEPRTVGRVDYRYRISTTEVTTAQWATFLNSFAPHIRPLGLPVGSPTVAGGTFYQGPGPDGVPGYAALPQEAQRTSQMGWRLAAIYCNWLHNGAPTGSNLPLSHFANGAYDISTFTENPDGTYNDQLAHNEGAKFWIPTVDEWHKAGYWDPNRFGEDEGGWWLFPNGTDERLEFGRPEDGGETNFGERRDVIPGVPDDVGSYPTVTSPWGLLDVSGGGREWLETTDAPQRDARGVAGTQAFQEESPFLRGDMLGWMFDHGRSISFANGSLRVAATVPGPGASAVFALSALLAARRRR